jgi:hypothetical protein
MTNWDSGETVEPSGQISTPRKACDSTGADTDCADEDCPIRRNPKAIDTTINSFIWITYQRPREAGHGVGGGQIAHKDGGKNRSEEKGKAVENDSLSFSFSDCRWCRAS